MDPRLLLVVSMGERVSRRRTAALRRLRRQLLKECVRVERARMLRMRHYQTVQALPLPGLAPWQFLWYFGTDENFINLTGLCRYVVCFSVCLTLPVRNWSVCAQSLVQPVAGQVIAVLPHPCTSTKRRAPSEAPAPPLSAGAAHGVLRRLNGSERSMLEVWGAPSNTVSCPG
jgi:hypothetical protein